MSPTPPAPRAPGRPGAHRRLAVAASLLAVLAGLGVAPAPAPAGPTSPVPASVVPAAAGAPGPGFGAPGTPARPGSERYVRDAYASVLGRGIDEPGLAYWGGRLDGGTSRATFAKLLVLSPESLRRQLRALYEDVGITPGPTDIGTDAEALRTGATSLEGVLVRLLSTAEFSEGPGGGTPEGFVAALYERVLDRPAEPAGAAYWVGRLEAGASRSTVARGFVLSTDRLRTVVAAAYDQVLGRTTDVPGRDYWVARMVRGTGLLDLLRYLLDSAEAWSMGCSLLDAGHCLLPFPNDQMTVPDPSTDTGRRVVLKSPWVPAPVGGPAFDPSEWNRQDGFSPGSAIMVSSRGIDPGQSGLAPLTDIGASLDPDAPLVLVDLDTGQRWPYWAELDSNAPAGPQRALVVRPARNLLDGHTYAVGIGPVRTASGAAVTAPAGFRVFRDQLPSGSRRVNEQREPTEAAIDAVVEAGLDRSTLHLAWTFTVASTRNLAERIVHMRDETLGGPAGQVAPDFTVTAVAQGGDQTTRVEGTFQVPLYLTGTGAPGSRLRLGPDHLPEPRGTVTAPFVCTVPDSARTTPARAGLYGHGLLGNGSQANSGSVRPLAREHNMVFCGTDWAGMSDSDIGNVLEILSDLSQFPEMADRMQQGFLNFMVLGRLMTLPDGLVTHPAFQRPGGAPAIDGGDLTYYGLSQGGIMGGALVATSPDITRGVLGVPGMNYSTLLERSVDFDLFFTFLAPEYPSALDRILMISVIQMLWDRGEANGYANHMTADPLPGTPTHEVLLQVAFGDHQVTQYAAEVMARTYGAATNDPPLAPGRLPDVAPLWDIDRIGAYPYAGSAIVYWDSGTPAPPVANQPNRAGEDPHGDPRSDPDARDQISAFLQPDGPVVDVCGGGPCVADGT
ncbi:MAG TPA: DUF4214 domain-containing protein [Acidimicrobiales bacterium]|nr:DUF4214 domain-containing protein [Acidimicrobiales bacterium]